MVWGLGSRSLLGSAGSPPCVRVIPRCWCLRRVSFPSSARALVSVWWPLQWKVAGAVAWRLGCGGRFLVVSCVGAARCGSRAVGSGLRWRVVVGECPCRGLSCVSVSRFWSRCPLADSWCGLVLGGWGGVGPSRVVCPSFARPPVLPLRYWCARCPVLLPVLVAPDVSLPPYCVARSALLSGCVPVTWCFSPPSCRSPSLCPFPSWCPGGLVVARSVGRQWPMPGSGLSAAISRGFRACRGSGCPEPRPGGGFPMPLVAWRLQGRSCWGWREYM